MVVIHRRFWRIHWSALSNLKYFAQGAGAILVSCICTKIIWEKNSTTTAAESETFLGSDALGCRYFIQSQFFKRNLVNNLVELK
jgi:hypothetical protein